MRSRRTLAAVLVGLSIISFGLASQASATPIVIFPTDDRRGVDAFLDGNFVLQLDMGLATVTRSMSLEERAAMEFDLSAIPEGSTILSATLTLFLPVLPAVVPQAGEVHGYTADGVVAAADLNATNLLASFNVNALTVSIPIPVGFLQGLLAADEDFAGLVLRNVTIPFGVFQFYTMDSGFEEFNPRLELDVDVAVPEPGSLALLGTALAAAASRKLAGRRRAAGRRAR
jgi:hypothetical protein